MRLHGRIAEQLPSDVDGLEHQDVLAMPAGPVTIGAEDDVAVLELVLAHVLDDAPDAERQRAAEEGEGLAFGQELGLLVVEPHAEIDHLVDDRIEGGAQQDASHLIGRGDVVIPDHLDGDRIHRSSQRTRHFHTSPNTRSRFFPAMSSIWPSL
jgi:hypothetical protein